MRQKYGRQRKKVVIRRLQVAWIISAFIATIAIVVAGSSLMKSGKDKFLEGQASDLIEENKDAINSSVLDSNGNIISRDDILENYNPSPSPGQADHSDTAEEMEDDVATGEVNTGETGDNSSEEMSTGNTNIGTDQNSNVVELEEDNTEVNIEDNTESNSENTESNSENTEIKEKVIALTFDDGPNPKVTNRILDVLEEHGARATFFVMGDRMDKYGDIVTRAYSIGSQIGNHTYSHKDLTKLNVEGIRHEVEYSNECIQKYAPVGDAVLRPPYGAKNDTVYKTIKVPIITWSVDTEDWKSRDKDVVAKHILETVQDGDIVLMHDLYESTADAIEYVVPKLIEMGYQLVTVDELFEAKGVALEAGVVYRKAVESNVVSNN